MQGRPASPAEGAGNAASVAPTLLKTRDSLLEQLPVGICFSDLTGALVRYNGRAAELWGLKPDPDRSAAATRASFKIYEMDGALIAPDATPMHDVLATRETIRNREMVIERADGSRVLILANINPLFGENGELMGAVECFNDVTETKRAQHNQKTLIDELNHRVKNTLATVQSLAAHSHATADASERAAFDER
jgi:transcriptional regulator with PAS, ATPase and Fis domain